MKTSTATVINRALNKTARRVLAHVADCSGCTCLGVASQVLSLTFATIRRHVNALSAAGLVEVRCNGARVPESVEATDLYQSGGVVFWTQPEVPSQAWINAEVERTSMSPYSFQITGAGRKAL